MSALRLPSTFPALVSQRASARPASRAANDARSNAAGQRDQGPRSSAQGAVLIDIREATQARSARSAISAARSAISDLPDRSSAASRWLIAAESSLEQSVVAHETSRTAPPDPDAATRASRLVRGMLLANRAQAALLQARQLDRSAATQLV